MRETQPSYVADVLSVRRLSPTFVRVELGGPGLAGFASLGVPDEGVVLQFPVDDVLPDAESVEGRWYTVRRVDAGTLTVDLALHAGGFGGEWAAAAEVGHQLRITHRNSWFKRPDGARWQVLLGDVVALPAIARIVEEAGDLPTTAVVEVPDPDDRQPLDGASTTWLHNPGLATRGSRLEQAARELVLPDGPGYVYVAGEASATRAVRRYLRHELGLPTGSYGVVGYWRVDRQEFERRLEQTRADTVAMYEEAVRAGADEEEAMDIYEGKLAAAGLI